MKRILQIVAEGGALKHGFLLTCCISLAAQPCSLSLNFPSEHVDEDNYSGSKL